MILESKHRHDFVSCDCGNLSIDGGTTYLKCLVSRPELMEDMSLSEEDGPPEDGGNDEFTTALMNGVEK